MKNGRFTKRRGAVPPIVTVIIIVASVVAAALAAYFIYSTTARGVRQVLLTVVGQPVLYTSNNSVVLFISFKNDGTADVDLTGSIVYIQRVDKSVAKFVPDANIKVERLVPGNSTALRYVAIGERLESFPDGALAILQTKDGYQTSFTVSKP